MTLPFWPVKVAGVLICLLTLVIVGAVAFENAVLGGAALLVTILLTVFIGIYSVVMLP